VLIIFILIIAIVKFTCIGKSMSLGKGFPLTFAILARTLSASSYLFWVINHDADSGRNL